MSLHNYTRPDKVRITKNFINGEFVDGSDHTFIDVINPATEEVVAKVAEGTAKDIERAIDAAHQALPKWRETPMRDRCQLILKLAEDIEKNLKEYVELETLDNGKPLAQSESDILEVINSLRYFSGWADKITGKTFSQPGNNLYYTRREPYGVVGLISPWNFPLLMCEWKFGPALAAGNCIVHKPSEVTPLTILRMAQSIKDVGFPAGVYNIVIGYGHTAGEALAISHRISKISFTGSTLIGRKILEYSAKSNLKKVGLELGGKTPVIVCPDADIDKAAELAWSCIMYNMGQCCIAGSRLFIHEKVYDQFTKKLAEFSKRVNVKDSFEGGNHGPQVNKMQFDKILGFINHGKNVEKLAVLCGGEKVGNKGYFIQPTVFAQVPDDSKLAQEEIFGPVLCVLKPWKTIDEVIQRANNTKYGLAAVVITNDMATSEKMVKSIDAGTVYVNCYCIPQSFIPFGGYKESGFGRDNGEEAILEYTHVKSVYYQLGEPKI